MGLPFLAGLVVSTATRKAAQKGAKELAKIAKKNIKDAVKKRKTKKTSSDVNPEKAYAEKIAGLENNIIKKVKSVKQQLSKEFKGKDQDIIDSDKYKKMLYKRLTDKEKAVYNDMRQDPVGSGEFELFVKTVKKSK